MKKSKRLPDQTQQRLLDEVRVELATPIQIPRINQLLRQHHYLGSLRPVGQRLYYPDFRNWEWFPTIFGRFGNGPTREEGLIFLHNCVWCRPTPFHDLSGLR